jgi:phenol 2-monooxygenase
MQYHLNGFRVGDPNVTKAGADTTRPVDKIDVAIIGCGPAGLTLAAQLASIGGMSVRIFDRKDGPLQVGQADGIACRSMEMFDAFGFADKVCKEAYWVNETVFWRPGPEGAGLARADRIQDVEDDLSYLPHTILNQARVHDFYLEIMRNSALRLEPDYHRQLVRLTRTDAAEYPVELVFDCLDDGGAQETVAARYVVGCDGARSVVRESLGYDLKGQAARQLWGVMDVLAVTDFPDIRLKCAIQSAGKGSMLIIPREGGYMDRLYIELDELHGDERASDRAVSAPLLEEKAREILAPYSFEVKEVAWFSAYEIGQRVCDAFDDVVGGGERRGWPHPTDFHCRGRLSHP